METAFGAAVELAAVKGAFIESVDIDTNRMEVHVWEGMATDEH